MFTLNLFSFNCDVLRPWGVYFQVTANLQIETLGELHEYLMVWLIIIILGIELIVILSVLGQISIPAVRLSIESLLNPNHKQYKPKFDIVYIDVPNMGIFVHDKCDRFGNTLYHIAGSTNGMRVTHSINGVDFEGIRIPHPVFLLGSNVFPIIESRLSAVRTSHEVSTNWFPLINVSTNAYVHKRSL